MNDLLPSDSYFSKLELTLSNLWSAKKLTIGNFLQEG